MAAHTTSILPRPVALSVQPGSPRPSALGVTLGRSSTSRRLIAGHAGTARVVGTTKIDGNPSKTPVSCRVRLYRDSDGALVGDTISDAAGNYEFTGLNAAQRYTALAYAPGGLYRAVAADNLLPAS